MSIKFSDTSKLDGLVQIYERELGYAYGEVSGNVTRLKAFTADSNQALDDFTTLAIGASGTWQYDDTNYQDYPIISTNILSGQRDYTFTTDEGGNLILDVAKVMLADRSGVFRELEPVDPESQPHTSEFYDNQIHSGLATRYDKLANGIILNMTPDYNMRLVQEGVAGLKMYVNRESSHFVYTDTDKMPGIPGLFHRYIALKPAMDKARRDTLAIYASLVEEVSILESRAKEYFARRNRDERKRITPARENNK